MLPAWVAGQIVEQGHGAAPGYTCAHGWTGAEGGNGALLSGDIFSVVLDRRWVTFMYSYPNYIPERPRTIRRALTLLEPYSFTRVYGAWWNRVVYADGHAAIRRSAERYLSYALDDGGPTPS